MAQLDNSESEYEEDEDVSIIVIDNGSYSIKAGFAGDDQPSSIFPSTVARPTKISHSMGMKDCYVGSSPSNIDTTINNPIQNRIITNWDDMEKIWHHTFY
eukprot:CAMPEP_0201570500 /NCGR_PEP_ID=MMETSP0190_2-20130828/12796_1 /ASSEMBLY_ACC=CAM_ASM_000263 /TAXON_ID=37353 /ORGANISM="Rosalina sp." /LENGTH=99 /DNA_ID=CAMNT_0047994105 /DNA_START=26 /DNA_END=322 /DNA_ORIENTATION=+